MAAHDHLGEMFHKALGIINTTDKEVIEGHEARTVMKAAGIRSWPVLEHPETWDNETGSSEGPDVTYADEILHTRQAHLHVPTLREYIAGDVPEFDEDYRSAATGKAPGYHPTLTEHRGSKWIDEGHHRIIASRLNQESSLKTWRAYSRNPWN